MKKIKIILLGLGGQGVLFSGKLLAKTAFIEGFKSSFLPSFGIEIQNGKVNAEVIINDSEIHNKLINEPDYILVFHQSRIPDLEKIKTSKTIIYTKDFEYNNSKKIDTNSILEVLNNPKLSNIAFLSYFIKDLNIFSSKSVSESIKKLLVNKQYNLSIQNFKLYQKIIKEG